MIQPVVHRNLIVRGRSAAECKAEVEHDPQDKWTASCSVGMGTMVTVRGHNSDEDAIADLNESLAKHGVSVSDEK